MSNKTHLPIFYTFLILLVSEHFLGVWGLIVGVPIFIFMLDVVEVPVMGGKRLIPPKVPDTAPAEGE